MNMKPPKAKLLPPRDDEPTLGVLQKNSKPDDTIKPIQLKIPLPKHTEIKTYASEQGMSITELMLAGYEMYRAKMG